jgi:hypothetical protein
MLFADYFEPFRAAIPEEERGDMMKAYYKRLTGDNEEEKLKWYISSPLFSFRRSAYTLQCQRVESLGNSHIQTDCRSRAYQEIGRSQMVNITLVARFVMKTNAMHQGPCFRAD